MNNFNVCFGFFVDVYFCVFDRDAFFDEYDDVNSE